MGFAAREPPDQKRVDRAEAQFAALGPLPRALHMVENPRHFRAGEIGIKQQPGFGGEKLFMSLGFQSGADLRRAPVLPDNGLVDRLARLALPHHRGFALVGDAEAADIFGRGLCLG